jgi:hypothetical protein
MKVLLTILKYSLILFFGILVVTGIAVGVCYLVAKAFGWITSLLVFLAIGSLIGGIGIWFNLKD